MERVKQIWCIVGKSRIKGTKTKFDNPIILCSYEEFEDALERMKRLNLDDELLEFEFKLESTNLHFKQD